MKKKLTECIVVVRFFVASNVYIAQCLCCQLVVECHISENYLHTIVLFNKIWPLSGNCNVYCWKYKQNKLFFTHNSRVEEKKRQRKMIIKLRHIKITPLYKIAINHLIKFWRVAAARLKMMRENQIRSTCEDLFILSSEKNNHDQIKNHN